MSSKMNRRLNLFWSLLFFLLSVLKTSAGNSDESYASCDEDSVPSSKSASSLTPNSFYKICPPVLSESESLGQPICGDGTAFSFMYSSPIQRLSNKNKITIEFMGGGACWDADTCDQMSNGLTFPEIMSEFTGYSCSEAEYGMEEDANLLCSSKFGDVDLTAYNSIVVPYCSQDVHMGDSYTSYGDDDDGGIYHHGAHNIMSVLNWVFKNFPNPSHIALTGCSAGGTVLPVAYDLINKHYNTAFNGGRTVNINVITDSPVYLTPEYFLTNALDNWNPWTILGNIGFKYSEWKYDTQYSTKLWEHVLKRGSNRDQWGFVSHTNDGTSQEYFQAMGAYYGDDDGGGDDDAGQSMWYSDTMESLNTIMKKFSNVDTFFIDGDGHCTLGLYYALQEYGFEDWASGIFKEQRLLMRSTSSVPLFLMSVFVGVGLVLAASTAKKAPSDVKSDSLLERDITPKEKVTNMLAPLISASGRFKSCPITAGYFVATSLYVLCMLLSNGFAHPLNNPSIGSSASTLSLFGINNPTLIVNEKQVYRLISSTFLCSGVLTYLMILHSILRNIRHLERIIDNSKVFATACAVIMFSSNLTYALVSEGASCSSMAFVLGLNCFSIGMHYKTSPLYEFPRPLLLTTIHFLLVCFLFPFNNYIMMIMAMVTGAILPLAFKIDLSDESGKLVIGFNKPVLLGIGSISGIIFILLLAGVPNPNEIYVYPYATGCEMKYSLDITDIAGQLSGQDRRKLKDNNDYDGLCAQFCIPHLIELPFSWSMNKYTEYAMPDGLCVDIGYASHMADKTYSYWGYALDVELYYPTETDDE